jgi:hypothetical protein
VADPDCGLVRTDTRQERFDRLVRRKTSPDNIDQKPQDQVFGRGLSGCNDVWEAVFTKTSPSDDVVVIEIHTYRDHYPLLGLSDKSERTEDHTFTITYTAKCGDVDGSCVLSVSRTGDEAGGEATVRYAL